MANKIVPTSNDPTFVQRTQLDGTDYLLWFAFNAREGRWYLDITDTENEPIQCGIKIVSQFPLTRSVIANKPPGTLVCLDQQSNSATLQDTTDAGLLSIGARHLLYYLEA